MQNIINFSLTTILHFIIWLIFSMRGLHVKRKPKYAKEFAIVALLCLPLNINGNVFTVLGNASSSNNIYSIFSLYQKADQDAFSLLGGIYQEAGYDATTFLGFEVYQKAGHDNVLVIGLSGYQKAENKNLLGIGISVFQNSKKESGSIMGLIGYQKSNDIALALCCFVGKQDSGQQSGLAMGLIGYQNSKKYSSTVFSMALYQRAGGKDSAFAMWSSIKDEDKSEK
ncbi:MAG: hypothetical protein A2915_02850 [Candidatus Yanofskybacteria bacterium RIFCSPLOWO2_01_FULL_41_34]|uniref:Uncharacterized protein n=1 Tax=Candidatus Yanofskybacteria bacterium RIFCSPHIGHO2_01_FULL_41_26 TaxID=1802661 RepID=A0A1F8EEE1_9BACT|nr:MAG: hypothetical protein A2649_03745 [Candidatus Yanofskybacteria bacterium RIFCSPHIGHO2_01_FULL_41_26]OGN20975.1 MAG: hypothetical protein A2915_02850 [Candidatus Yanofskybacteria bacterium RIFCSPLOWO2_01_FULL_41_34]